MNQDGTGRGRTMARGMGMVHALAMMRVMGIGWVSLVLGLSACGGVSAGELFGSGNAGGAVDGGADAGGASETLKVRDAGLGGPDGGRLCPSVIYNLRTGYRQALLPCGS